MTADIWQLGSAALLVVLAVMLPVFEMNQLIR